MLVPYVPMLTDSEPTSHVSSVARITPYSTARAGPRGSGSPYRQTGLESLIKDRTTPNEIVQILTY